MIEINNVRNDLVHKVFANLTLDETKAKNLIEKAIECLKDKFFVLLLFGLNLSLDCSAIGSKFHLLLAC